jgi:hypothetical protein
MPTTDNVMLALRVTKELKDVVKEDLNMSKPFTFSQFVQPDPAHEGKKKDPLIITHPPLPSAELEAKVEPESVPPNTQGPNTVNTATTGPAGLLVPPTSGT